MFISFKRDITKEILQEQLKVVAQAGMDADKIDGFGFIKSEFKLI